MVVQERHLQTKANNQILKLLSKYSLIVLMCFSNTLLQAQDDDYESILKPVNIMITSLYSAENYDEGIKVATNQISKFESNKGAYQQEMLRVAYLYANLATLQVQVSQYDESEMNYKKAIEVAETTTLIDKKLFALASFHERYAVLVGKQDRYKEKVALFRTAKNIRKTLLKAKLSKAANI